MKFKNIFFTFIISIFALHVNAQEQIKKEYSESTFVAIGDKAPDFRTTMLDGTTIKLSELKGKVVLLNFWATWCGPCLMEFNEIPKTILNRFKNEDFVFLPISRGETVEIVQKKMKQLKTKNIDFNVGLDPSKKIYNLYANKYIPRNFLIDKEGNITYLSIGYKEEELKTIAKKIEALLKSN